MAHVNRVSAYFNETITEEADYSDLHLAVAARSGHKPESFKLGESYEDVEAFWHTLPFEGKIELLALAVECDHTPGSVICWDTFDCAGCGYPDMRLLVL